MKNKLTLLFSFMMVSSCLFAGNVEWQSGYIVTNQGDTIRGLLGYQDRASSWNQCEYKASEKDSVVSYFSWEIKSCTFDSGLYYESHRIKDEEIDAIYLIRCLEKGNISLYDVSIRREDFTLYDRYYIVDSIHNRTLYMKPAEEATFSSIGTKRIQATLRVLLSDNQAIQKDIEDFSNKSGELAALFHKYNNLVCSEERYVTYVEQPKKRNFWITPFIGGQMNIAHDFYSDILDGMGHGFSPLIGVGGSMNLDSQSLRWMMNVELELNTTNLSLETTYTDMYEKIHYYHSIFKSVNLFNNITFEYRFGNKVRPFVEVGLFQRGMFPTKNYTVEELAGEVSDFIYRNYTLGLLAGVGVAIPFGKGNYIPVKLRYYLPFMGRKPFDMDTHELSLSVGVSFKVK